MTTPTEPASYLLDPERVEREARRALQEEAFDRAVEAAVEALRTKRARGFLGRLIDRLPFTIQRKTK